MGGNTKIPRSYLEEVVVGVPFQFTGRHDVVAEPPEVLHLQTCDTRERHVTSHVM